MKRRSNFEIPANFSFRPFQTEWRFATAETVEWAATPYRLRSLFGPAGDDPVMDWIRSQIYVPYVFDKEPLKGLVCGGGSHYEVLLPRYRVPPEALQRHENCQNTPDISGRRFRVLICRNPEIKYGFELLEPGDAIKNAWLMRNEFLSLGAHPKLGWDYSVQQFLNKWGYWKLERGYVEAWDFSYPRLTALAELASKQKIEKPDFVLASSHLLRAEQGRYRKALSMRNAHEWLRMHPLKLETGSEFPFFRVRTGCCADAIGITITIDHLAKRRFGLCKRCRKPFERTTRHKKNYCSERCFNAAAVQRWRDRQRKIATKGAKRNAKD